MLNKRKLGTSGVELSELTVGTWGLCAEAYGKVFPEQVIATLERALDQGITSFDVAPTWGDDGESERTVAQVAGTRRDELTYITRIGQVSSEYGVMPAFAPDALRAQCEASLGRLVTDRIDVLLLHHPTFDDLRKDELRATMDSLREQGKVRSWGATVSNAEEGRAAIVSGAQVLCVPFNLLVPELVWDLTSECRERGVGLLARSVLMYGMLAGRWSEKKRFTPDDHRMYRWTPESIAARVRKSNELASKLHPSAPSMATLALRFVLAHEEVSSAIFGPRTPAQVVAAREALESDMTLSVVDMQFIYNSIR
jgi:aryl-alcohol dehydrogenase-like predicted oxidoreductase